MDQTVSRPLRTRSSQASRWILYALPVVTVVVIAIAVFVVGAPTSYRAARVWGGPTEGVRHFSVRVQAVERYYEVERGLGDVALEGKLSDAGRVVARLGGRTDAQGFAELAAGLPAQTQGPLALEIRRAGGQLLAGGPVKLTRQEWLTSARRRGGWIRGRDEAGLWIRVRPVRGVFAVPFSDPLLIEVRDAEGPVAGAKLSLTPEGVLSPETGLELTTDRQGRAEVVLTPREHVVLLGVEAVSGTERARWYSALPVVPGALHATLEGRRLRIESAVPRDAAFYSIVNELGRLGGGRLALEPDGRGGSAAEVTLPAHAELPLWAVVSSEPDMSSPAAVGWPLDPREPADTLGARDVLLLDGLPAAYQASRERPRRARTLAGLFALLALLLAVALITWQVRAADVSLRGHFERAEAEQGESLRAKRTALALLTAVLCIALGFVLVALITLARID